MKSVDSRFIMVCLLGFALALNGCASVHWGSDHDYLPLSAHVSAEPQMATGSGDIHVITWNLHGSPDTAPMSNRLARVAKELIRRLPDLIVLQEIWFDGDKQSLQAALHDDYDLISDAPTVHSGFLSAVAGHRNGGLLTFLSHKSSWKTIGGDAALPSTFHEYQASASAWRISEGDGLGHKGFQRFELERDGTRLTIYNTHLQSQYGDHRRYVAVRSLQIAELTNDANAEWGHATNSVTQLAFGDFNTSPTELELYKQLVSGWDDLTRHKRAMCDCSGTSLDYDEVPGTEDGRQTIEVEWIDYALARPGTGVRAVDITRILSDKVDWPFSDHHGLEVILALRP